MAQQVNFLTLLKMQRAAKEINILFCNEAIDLKANEEALKSQLLEAKGFIEETDVISEETQAVLDALEAQPSPKATGKKQEKLAEKKIVPETVEVDYEELAMGIEDASDLSELKQIAAENAIFSGVFKRIKTFKDAEDLREELLEIIQEETGGGRTTNAPVAIMEEAPEAPDLSELRDDLENAADLEDLKVIALNWDMFADLDQPLKAYKDFDILSNDMWLILEQAEGGQAPAPKKPEPAQPKKQEAPAKPEKKKSAVTVVKDEEPLKKPVLVVAKTELVEPPATKQGITDPQMAISAIAVLCDTLSALNLVKDTEAIVLVVSKVKELVKIL